MTTPSHEEKMGIIIHVYTPLAIGDSMFVTELRQNISSYNHQISAVGGYMSADITIIRGVLGDLEDWLWNGLGRHIVTYSPTMDVIFEGFINTMSLNVGASTIERGPLIDVVNRCIA